MLKTFPIETSARHIHLCRADVDKLFGEGYQLSPMKELFESSHFVSVEHVSIAGPRDRIDDVTIVGPLRDKTQVEVSLSDARRLGIKPPIRVSGDLEGSEKCRIIGPKGEVDLTEGVIVIKRHIHISRQDAEELELKDGQIVSVLAKSPERSVIFQDVVVEYGPDSFDMAMHVDTDEANAAGLTQDSQGRIVNVKIEEEKIIGGRGWFEGR